MLVLVLCLLFTSIFIIVFFFFPFFYEKSVSYNEQRQRKLSNNVEQLLNRDEAKELTKLFILAPLVLSVVCFFLFPENLRVAGLILGLILGFLFPSLYIKRLKIKTRKLFEEQLVDGLMIMASSLRGGLSLIQSLEAVVEEMPNPINKEFNLVLGENKMGVTLEDSLAHLYNRMESVALQHINTAILLSRETGGNLPVIFERISNTLRENKKIQMNMETLTLQGKIQGIVMSILPIGFSIFLYRANKELFMNFVETDIGRKLLLYCFVSWLIGSFLIIKISKLEDF